MKNKEAIIKSAIASVIALATVSSSIAASNPHAAPPGMEKCYGIVKKGMNDCETRGSTCSGSAVKDNQPDAYLLMPEGLCTRIVGGSLTSK